MSIFAIIPILPLLFYVADGYFEKNILKGSYHIIGFVLLMASALILLRIFGLYFALAAPLFIMLLFVVKPKSN